MRITRQNLNYSAYKLRKARQPSIDLADVLHLG